MKKVMIDGVEFEQLYRGSSCMFKDESMIHYRPIPKPRKTLIEAYAKLSGESEEYIRKYKPGMSAALDTIEERLAKLEEELKK